MAWASPSGPFSTHVSRPGRRVVGDELVAAVGAGRLGRADGHVRGDVVGPDGDREDPAVDASGHAAVAAVLDGVDRAGGGVGLGQVVVRRAAHVVEAAADEDGRLVGADLERLDAGVGVGVPTRHGTGVLVEAGALLALVRRRGRSRHRRRRWCWPRGSRARRRRRGSSGGAKSVSTAPVSASSFTRRPAGWPFTVVNAPPAKRLVPSVVSAHTWPLVLAVNVASSDPSLMQNAARLALAAVWSAERRHGLGEGPTDVDDVADHDGGVARAVDAPRGDGVGAVRPGGPVDAGRRAGGRRREGRRGRRRGPGIVVVVVGGGLDGRRPARRPDDRRGQHTGRQEHSSLQGHGGKFLSIDAS